MIRDWAVQTVAVDGSMGGKRCRKVLKSVELCDKTGQTVHLIGLAWRILCRIFWQACGRDRLCSNTLPTIPAYSPSSTQYTQDPTARPLLYIQCLRPHS